VIFGLATPSNVTVRALLTIRSRRMPQLLDADDHRSGSTADAGPRMIDRQLVPRQDGDVTTAPATMQSAAMRRSGA
jgi:hypothetical protein